MDSESYLAAKCSALQRGRLTMEAEPPHIAQQCVGWPWAEQKAELLQSQKPEHQIAEDCSHTLKNNVIYPAGFQIFLGLMTMLFLLFFVFWSGNL